MNIIIAVILSLSLSSCLNDTRLPRLSVEEYESDSTKDEVLFFITGDEEFSYIENSKAFFLYTEHYLHKYDRYRDFLDGLINHPGEVSVSQYVKLEKNRVKPSIEKEFRRDLKRSLTKYLSQEGEKTWRIKEEYRPLSLQIAKSCFDNGFYIHSFESCFSNTVILVSSEALGVPAALFPSFFDDDSGLYVYSYVEESPRYIKGEGRFHRDLISNVDKSCFGPDSLLIFVNFVVDSTGHLCAPRINGWRNALDEKERDEILQSLELCQQWTPGQINGNPVNTIVSRNFLFGKKNPFWK